ncbi:MAG: ribosome maturation factor RimP [Pseudomonadota bacterium]|nr:ribosome maturation factor RimP [Pseudomonadota bacterium]
MQVDLVALREILEPPTEALGYELVHLEVGGRGKDAILRLYIDAPGGIQLEDCAMVSRHLGAMLDVEDPIHAAYSLEVSSPGLDRPLVKPEHFERFVGSRVKVNMHSHVMGRRRFTGALQAADDQQAVVEVDGEPYELPYDDMESARLAPEY